MEPVYLRSLVDLSAERAEPLTVQLYRDLLAAIRGGRLGAGSILPSSRAGAAALGLSRNTVNAAYDLLRAEGAVTIRQGAAPRVIGGIARARPVRPVSGRVSLSARGEALAASGRGRMQSAVMAVGQPDEALFPRDEWARILRRQARLLHGSAFGYEDYCGLLRLRQRLAQRLTDHRGMFLSAEQVLITPGSQASLVLLAQALAAPGDRALIEDPGYVGARLAFAGAGLRLCPMPVDGEGADPGAVDPGIASGAKLIYLTPANHFPLGHRMSLARRSAAIAYAQEVGALIVEDDYDSEFLWRGRAIAAMQAMAPERVITIGSLSKSLMPGLRLGWMVVPMELVEPLADAQRNLGYAANLHAQGAFADLIESGRYHSHLARIAHRYAERGAALAEALAAIPGVAVTPPDGGVQLAAHLAPEVEGRAVAALRAAGFGAGPLSRYCLKAACSGLVVGFADATPERIALFARTLQETLAQR